MANSSIGTRAAEREGGWQEGGATCPGCPIILRALFKGILNALEFSGSLLFENNDVIIIRAPRENFAPGPANSLGSPTQD